MDSYLDVIWEQRGYLMIVFKTKWIPACISWEETKLWRKESDPETLIDMWRTLFGFFFLKYIFIIH